MRQLAREEINGSNQRKLKTIQKKLSEEEYSLSDISLSYMGRTL